MLDKLRIAGVLLLVGALSGLSIWAVNEITAPIIEERQLGAEAEAFKEIFPDLASIDIQSFDHDILNQMTIIMDASGNEIGRVYRGTSRGYGGPVITLVGIATDGTIAKVVVTTFDDETPGIRDSALNKVPNFTGQNASSVSYDANTGATDTYNAIRRVVEAAVMQEAGDVRLEAYIQLYPDAASYESETHNIDSVDELYKVFNDAAEHIGYVYELKADDKGLYVALDLDNNFVGVRAQNTSDSALISALEAFKTYEGQAIDQITFDVSGALELSVKEALSLLFDAFSVTKYFATADSVSDAISIDHDLLTKRFDYFNAAGMLVGTVYQGEAVGYNEDAVVVTLVAIDASGVIVAVEIFSHSDTGGLVNRIVIGNLEVYLGLTDISEVDTEDTFSGATTTANAVHAVVHAALESASSVFAKVYFDDATKVGELETLNRDYLSFTIPYYDDSNTVVGRYYQGQADGYNGENSVTVGVVIDASLEIVQVMIIEHNDTARIVNNNVIPNLELYQGISSVDAFDLDAFSGATMTAEAVLQVVTSALAEHSERNGE